MDFIKIYSDILKKNSDNPDKVRKMLKAGYNLEYINLNLFGDKNLPKSLRYLAKLCMKFTLEPLRDPENTAFVNVFTPTEFLHAFDMHPQLIEAYSSYISGTRCEDMFIDKAESVGVADSLCSYHKTFLGAAMSNVIQKPKFAITTSTACDGNVNTFRCLADIYKIDKFVIDVPYEYSRDAENYVEEQLKEMVTFIEDNTHKKLDESKLKEIILNENQSIDYYKRYLESLKNKYFPNTLTSEMFKVFTTHPGMGRADTLKFYKLLAKDIEKYPDVKAKKRLLWVHLLPFYSESIKSFLDTNADYQLLISDMNADYLHKLDVDNPYGSIAKKIILNSFNGSYSRRANNILNLSKELNADGVINFCHFGCKQSSGGSLILKDLLEKNNIPMLSIDGDAVDRRNSQEGQNKTRLEAFFEMIDRNEEEVKDDSLYVQI
ncbi:2-hydroxyacyl-CoA dehydratase family protein [Clostridium sardiniense]|uniref:2-hydroxyacyl-CoA dehydratase family protein n=1 Tax=Clostridium sardiniense TaxID=29369 RepID=A0ABS7KUJ5_CLOSR|nr:2-hydroxyacyl-CoA dehydratase family protein [Clostridium sardiniense]MBY0754263.1 2-hydroxyacyl-CoA dehydratase family protein [Clostridium sardiniense]MDQ0461240.1 benzoyl-CoA reductase/2-hydroxyglutaryl-CoA dehydratase subunit BcrC/BadD/HgdB [Clostridium sardiniense]